MKVFLFDIDGTLIHTSGAGRAALARALAELFQVEDEIPAEMVLGSTDRGIAEILFTRCGVALDDAGWHRFHDAYLKHLQASLVEKPGKILSNVQHVLSSLAVREDVLSALLTGNTRQGASLKLGHFQLLDWFLASPAETPSLPLGGFGDLHPVRDDVAREALHAVEARLGRSIDPADVWVVGDTPRDVQCGRSIGARTAAVATGWHSRDELSACRPDLLWDDLGELLEVL